MRSPRCVNKATPSAGSRAPWAVRPARSSREIRRNSRTDGGYRPSTAHDFARWRRSRSRRNQRFTPADWAIVLTLLKKDWSPEQISGRLKKNGVLRISHETIYRHIWHDKRRGGTRFKLLRQAGKKRRKRYGAYDSRGRLAGKRHISERPPAIDARSEVGHWEIDTVLGSIKACIVTLVERATGYLLIGKLKARTVAELNRATRTLVSSSPLPVRTITADNGTEFHGYADLENQTGALSTSPPRTTPGSAAPTKTPTASSGSTSQREPAWRGYRHGAVTPSLRSSIPAPGSVSTSSHQRRHMTPFAIKPCCASNLMSQRTAGLLQRSNAFSMAATSWSNAARD